MSDKSNILADLVGAPCANKVQSSSNNNVELSDKEDENENVKSHDLLDKMDLGKLTNMRPTINTRQRQISHNKTGLSLSTSGSAINNNNNNSNITGRQHKLKQRFTVIRKLGKGTYGKVQLAINKQTGQEVAIKTIKKTKIENDQDLQRVRREIQIMSSIEHPHIIHIYEVFENKDKIVLVMQYAPGGELYEYVSQSKLLDDTEARRLFRQIATAIYYCHQNKICHRDLKLENILLDEKNNAKLADFGLSNVFDKARQLKTFCGSPLYASPEIVQGLPYEGPEVDCWSLGVLLYTLVYGAMPFDGSNFKRLVKQISDASYFEPKQKSPASPLIKRLLCADPGKRANILDICSDPWVNGHLFSNRQNRNPLQQLTNHDSQQQQQPTCPASLLKVAQDMANLTPVRFDILLALTADSARAEAASQMNACNAASKPPRPSQSPKATSPRITTPETPSMKRMLSSSTCLMEVEETKARPTSPVASYIVRDLDSQNNAKVSTDSEVPTKSEPDNNMSYIDTRIDQKMEEVEPSCNIEISATQNDVQVESPKEMDASPLPLDSTADNVQMDDSENHNLKKEPIEMEVVAASDEVESVAIKEESLLEEPREQATTPLEIDKEKEETTNVELQVEKMEFEVEPIVDVELKVEVESVQKQDEVEQQKPADVPAEEAKVEPVEEASKVDAANAEVKVDSIEGEEKPKKMKKRIVVVRKKKRVAKKDTTTDGANEEDRSNKSDKEQQVTANSVQEEKKTTTPKIAPRSAKANGPGKVRIPDTFQANNAQQESVERSSASSQPPQSRRQSSLVAEVSQKLLQQLQNIADERTEREAGPVLPGVKVSDKKEEFERRASLVAEHAPIIVAAAKQEALNKRLADVEPQKIEDEVVLKYALDLDKIMQVTSIEQVNKMEAHEVVVLPRARNSDHQVNQLQLLRRLSGQQNLSMDNKPKPESRSDSVETIKPDDDAATPTIGRLPYDSGAVRSSLEISLAPAGSGQELNKYSSASSVVAPQGPTPIMRSYKKVTFTKDGACITETGKIYSTKADDGTMRRVERKSKITHYPDPNNRREEQEEETLVYGDTESEASNARRIFKESSLVSRQSSCSVVGGHQTNQASTNRARNLERLIMPSSQLFNSDLTGDDGPLEDDYDSSFRRRSLFSRHSPNQPHQLGRTDSNSSCSSSSTDVFDDIFDDWTGAISMFKRRHATPTGRSSAGSSHNRSGARGNSLLERAFAGDPALLPFGQSLFSRARKSSSRGFGNNTSSGQPYEHSTNGHNHSSTARCESAQPQRGYGESGHDIFNTSRPHHTHLFERPSSALEGSGRHQAFINAGRSSSLLHQMDPFNRASPIDDLFQELELEHASLRQRLAKQHKQLWKGSTPSLFQNDLHQTIANEQQQDSWLQADGETMLLRDQHTQRQRTKLTSREPHTSWQYLRPQEFELQNEPHRTRSSSQSVSSAQHSRIVREKPVSPQQVRSNPIGQNLGESQSSSSFLRQSIPLRASVIRKKEASSSEITHLPPQSTRRSLSKTSLVQTTKSSISSTSGLMNKLIGEKQQLSHQASFIELKRTPSSSTTNQQIESIVKTNSSSKSTAFWEGRTTPVTNSVKDFCPKITGASSPPYDNDMQSEQQQQHQPSFVKQEESLKRDCNDSRIQYWLRDSTGNLSSSLSGSQSSASAGAEAVNNSAESNKHQRNIESFVSLHGRIGDNLPQHQQVCNLMSNQPATIATCSSTSSVTSKQRIVLVKPTTTNDEAELLTCNRSKKTFSTTEFDDLFAGSSPNTPPSATLGTNKYVLGSTSPKISPDTLHWMHSGINTHRAFDLEPEDSSVSNAELESQSTGSSSLLDQLRSRGYRSMINQRMVAGENPLELNQVRENQKAMTSSSMSVVKTESQSRIVVSTTSGSNMTTSKLIEHQVFQSSATLNEQIESDDALMNLKRKRGEQNYQPDDKNSQYNIDILDSSDTSFCLPSDNKQQQPSQVDITNEAKNPTPDADENQTRCEDGQNIQSTKCQAQETELDPDVLEAKENIRSYLDSVKETELFLKTVQKEEEENLVRKRQQMLLFDNYLLSSKLNGMRRKMSDSFEHRQSAFCESGLEANQLRSAPIRSQLEFEPMLSYKSDLNQYQSPPSFQSNHMTSFSPSENLIPKPVNSVSVDQTDFYPFRQDKTTLSSSSYNNLDSELCSTTAINRSRLYLSSFENLTVPTEFNSLSSYSSNSPLVHHQREPQTHLKLQCDQWTAPITGTWHSNYSTRFQSGTDSNHLASRATDQHFRRSRSQLGDQFNSHFKRASSRPLSANLDSLADNGLNSYSNESSKVGNPYFAARAKRSGSQVRYPSAGRYAKQAMLNEYKSAYCQSNPVIDTVHVVNNEDDDMDGMSAYRASAYIPKVVPDGGLGKSIELSNGTGDKENKHRRKSLQTLSAPIDSMNGKDDEENTSRYSGRRCSLTEADTGESSTGTNRLSQLEQRIKENKKRREQLLSGKSSPARPSSPMMQPIRPSRRQQADESELPNSRLLASDSDNNNAAHSSQATLKFSRPSRLESMEARIKRRSYCVRVAECSPDRSNASSVRSFGQQKQSLEKWRQQSNARNWSARSSLSNSDSNNTLFQSIGSSSNSARSNNMESHQVNGDIRLEKLKLLELDKEDED